MTSDLNSSASCAGSLEDACSVAVMYASMGGYLGVMAKLGPFWSRDNCSLVRGVLDRLMTHFSIHVWLSAGGWEPGCWVGIHCAVGRCGGHGCGRNCSWVGSWSGSSGYTGWHILVSAQGVLVVDVVNIFCMPVYIIKVSITFEI